MLHKLPSDIGTAADLLAFLAQPEMRPVQRRDLVSAVKRVCEMMDCSPASLQLHVPDLRERLGAIRPTAQGISEKTFANVRSLFGAALELAGLVDGISRGSATRHPKWAALAAGIANRKDLKLGLAAFLNWCAENDVAPEEVDDAVLQRFVHWLENRTLCARPRLLIWGIPRHWARAQSYLPDWPAIRLQKISFKAPSEYHAWEDFPESLWRDAENYLAMRANPDIFEIDPNYPKRPLAPATVRQQREHIRLAASIDVKNGVPAQSITSLAELLHIERFKAVLRHYHNRADGKPNAQAILVGHTLIDVARYYVKVPEPALKELKATAAKLPQIPSDLTPKNKALLRALEDDEVRARLLFLPETLMREVERLRRNGRIDHVKAEIALAIAILLIAPLRCENLILLNWSNNFQERHGPKGPLLLYIPKHETKTKKRDLTFEIPVEIAQIIRWYRKTILPPLGADPNGDLFVNRWATRKDQGTLSDQITGAIEKHVGVHMTPHQFRHFAACLYLEEHPEGFQAVTDLLGHSFSKTTLVYAGSSSRRASRSYAQHLFEERRKLQLAAHSRKRR